jgi:hypothetical protein
MHIKYCKIKLKTKLRGLSPWAKLYWPNYFCLSLKLAPTLRIKGATWSPWHIPTAIFSDF